MNLLVALVLLTVFGVGYLVALTRKGRAASARLGSRRLTLRVPMDPATAFARLSGLRGRLKVDDADAQRKVLVLSSPVTFGSWGFLYPVFISEEPGGSCIQIGIHSKVVQLGPLVTRAHRQCAEDVGRVLGLPPARTVSR